MPILLLWKTDLYDLLIMIPCLCVAGNVKDGYSISQIGHSIGQTFFMPHSHLCAFTHVSTVTYSKNQTNRSCQLR